MRWGKGSQKEIDESVLLEILNDSSQHFIKLFARIGSENLFVM
jgi:hypothetical protein